MRRARDAAEAVRDARDAAERVVRHRPDESFEEPWQARAFASALVAVESLGLQWDAFRDELKGAVAAEPERPYFESWLAALESLLERHGVGQAG